MAIFQYLPREKQANKCQFACDTEKEMQKNYVNLSLRNLLFGPKADIQLIKIVRKNI